MKLSIITINLNNAPGLRRTMESVAAQECRDFEYVVVDGASTDGSVELMRGLAENIASNGVRVDAVSEPDSGLYNAMNKGVRRACGDYVLMLNSGDYLVDSGVVGRILPELDGTDIVQGNTIKTAPDGSRYVYRGYGRSEIDFIDVQQGHFVHQASFCRRDLFERFGEFDESYKIDGDTVFYIKCLGYGDATFRYVDVNVAYFEQGGRSDAQNAEWKRRRQAEFERWSSELFSRRLWDTCVDADRKVRLYDRLHAHPLAWKITMGMLRLTDLFKR